MLEKFSVSPKKSKDFVEKSVKILMFVVDGHIVRHLTNQLLYTAGNVAESILLFSVLWLTAHYVTYSYMNSVFDKTWLATLDSWAVLGMALLPEIVLYAAIVTVVKHGKAIFKNFQLKGKKTLHIPSIVWTILYGAPTIAFAVMTYSVFNFVAYSSKNYTINLQADPNSMFIRILSSWFYVVVSLIFMKMNGKTFLERDSPFSFASTIAKEDNSDARTIVTEEIINEVKDNNEEIADDHVIETTEAVEIQQEESLKPHEEQAQDSKEDESIKKKSAYKNYYGDKWEDVKEIDAQKKGVSGNEFVLQDITFATFNSAEHLFNHEHITKKSLHWLFSRRLLKPNHVKYMKLEKTTRRVIAIDERVKNHILSTIQKLKEEGEIIEF